MEVSQTSQSSPPTLDLRNPSISISEVNREGVVSAMFQRDPTITEWLANQFFDSHIERTETGGIELIPNANYYQCPLCKAIKSREASVIKTGYLICSGTQAKQHELTYTSPMDWKPLLKTKGLYYLLGQVGSTLNTNIATGNLSNSEADAKRKMSLEDRLRYEGFYIAYSGLAVIVGQFKSYVADWVIEEKKLDSVFTMSFCMNYLITMTKNITANSTKGKGMAAASKAMETKISQESTTHHDVRYDYPAAGVQGQRKSMFDRAGEIFSFGPK